MLSWTISTTSSPQPSSDMTDKVSIMVERCGGLDRIEQLQSHKNEEIYHKALWIIETFFPDGDPKFTIGGGFREKDNWKGVYAGKKNRKRDKLAAPERSEAINGGTRTGNNGSGRGGSEIKTLFYD